MDTLILSTRKALVYEGAIKDLSKTNIKTLPSPQVDTGSAVVQVLHSCIVSYQRDILDGTRDYPLPYPLVGGFSGIARVVAVGHDAVSLKPGALVYVDGVLRARDDLDAVILSGISDGFNEGGNRLMKDVWRDGIFTDYAKLPLENCFPLHEDLLLKKLGYKTEQLSYVGYMLIAYGGLRDIDLEAGETIAICPATGGFGGAGVLVAIATGAKVIAMGRNEKELARIKAHVLESTPRANIETMKITGDEGADAETLRGFGTLDAVLDLSPAAAGKSSHLLSAINALRRKGRVSLMGGFPDLPLPSFALIAKDITIKAKFMYERSDIYQFIKMLERGLFPLGQSLVDVKSYSLEDWKAALDMGADHVGLGRFVVISPQQS